jgi:ribosome biogenesis protein UTP30
MTSHSFDKPQAGKAIKALYAWLKKEKKAGKGKKDMFESEADDFIHLTVSLKKTQPVRKDKPVRIPLNHALYSLDEMESCLIVKDQAGEGKKAAKARIEESNILGVSKVLGVSNIRKKFATHEQKRQLCRDYPLFLADTRILPLLPKLLGKTFFKKKKTPVPVELRGSTAKWKQNIQDAITSTYAHLSGGSCFTIRIAKPNEHSQKQVLENLVSTVERLSELENIGKWKNIQSLFLKTTSSVSLPIYQSGVAAQTETTT